jgi:hypothetical protein
MFSFLCQFLFVFIQGNTWIFPCRNVFNMLRRTRSWVRSVSIVFYLYYWRVVDPRFLFLDHSFGYCFYLRSFLFHRTFFVGADIILISIICSTFGTSFFGLMTHASGLLTTTSPLISTFSFSTGMTSFLLRTFCPLKLLLHFSLHLVQTKFSMSKFSSSYSSYSLVISTHDPGLYCPSIFVHPTLSQSLGNISWLTGKSIPATGLATGVTVTGIFLCSADLGWKV